MKAKFFALSLLTAACMASCSDSSIDTDVISPEQGELTTYRFKANVMLPQEMAGSVTRAQGDQEYNDDGTNKVHNDGVEQEYTVDKDKIFFAVYNADGIALTRATIDGDLNWVKDNDNALVTIGADVTLKATQKPKWLVVFVNLTEKERTNLTGQNLDNLLTGMENDGKFFRPGRNYLSAALGNDGQTFYQRPASFRNMMLERYANLKDEKKSGFFMMNSSWNSDANNDTQGRHNIRAVDVSNCVLEESEYLQRMATSDNKPETALVYIERVVAKVNTIFDLTNKTAISDAGKGYWVNSSTPNDLPVVKINQKQGYNNGTYTEGSETKSYAPESYYVKFDGWQLNATNKSFKPLKDIGESPSYFNNIAGNNYKAFRDGRSYWAIDLNYEQNTNYYLTNGSFKDGDYGWAYGNPANTIPQLNYYSLTNMKRLKFGTAAADGDIKDYTDYCFENTMVGASHEHTGAVTHVLVRAQYGKMDGSTFIPYGKESATGAYVKNSDNKYKNIYRVAKTIYEEEGLIHYIYDHLKAMYPTDMTGISQIKLEHNNKNFYNHNDVKSHVIVTALNGKQFTGLDGEVHTITNGDVTEIVFGEATIYTFERGVCYYSIPIKHFAEGKKVGDEGYFGVVRNHWYQITIDQVNSFGHPATPGEGPDPNDPDKPYDPENPGGTNPGNDPTDPTKPVQTNPTDPDNPQNPNDPRDPTNPGPNNPNTPPTNPGDPDTDNPHDPGKPNPGKPIIPEDSEDDDFNLNARIKVLSWAKMKMDAQLGGMQTWK